MREVSLTLNSGFWRWIYLPSIYLNRGLSVYAQRVLHPLTLSSSVMMLDENRHLLMWRMCFVRVYSSRTTGFIDNRSTGLFGHLNLPTIVFACKSDLEKRVDSRHADSILQVYSVGLIEVSAVTQQGKSKIRTAFDWIFHSIFSDRGTNGDRDSLQNPASPSILSTTYATPWDISRADSATPTASSATSMQASQSHFGRTLKPRSNRTSPPTSPDSPHSPPTPTSPARARSMSDLLSEAESARRDHREGADKDREHSPSSRSAVLTTNGSGTSPILPPPQVSEPLAGGEAVGSLEDVVESSRENVSREP